VRAWRKARAACQWLGTSSCQWSSTWDAADEAAVRAPRPRWAPICRVELRRHDIANLKRTYRTVPERCSGRALRRNARPTLSILVFPRARTAHFVFSARIRTPGNASARVEHVELYISHVATSACVPAVYLVAVSSRQLRLALRPRVRPTATQRAHAPTGFSPT
jgi:hypothetical protein